MSDSPRQAVNLNWMKTEPHRGSGESAEDFARRLQRDESPVAVSDLAAFLTARIGEDEAAARAAAQVTFGVYIDHLERHSPARVLREAEAKRKILALATLEVVRGSEVDYDVREMLDAVLQVLAKVYADHPDYQQDWA